MFVSATELKSNVNHYLELVAESDVFITKNGKIVAKMIDPTRDKQSLLDGLVGITVVQPESIEEAGKEKGVHQ
ncbi:MAG: type II toxin-antitoxin system Phd/YefM family antitoxin [Spirochaetaceae bacterium]|nr:type II toxin-antitoxin system Phd/YefM family antitoxin [Spirochaetaceae bacterium]